MDITKIQNKIKQHIVVDIKGCWIWQLFTHKGYGRLTYNYTKYRVHRLSYIVFNGPIDKGLYVLHTCDTPSCVNPSHLILGTQEDNLNDMRSKDRDINTKGEHNKNSKLTSEQVIEIRSLRDIKTYQELSNLFNVSKTCINKILTRTSWKHI